MGRTDAVPFMRELAAEWTRLGATVTWEPGWDTRGNGSAANYEGAIVHHTATPSSAAKPNPTLPVLIKGRTDLAGPLCNVTGPWCTETVPRLHIVSARPANHAGASGGRSMGPLPVTAAFNARVLGLEIDYAGTTPMATGQYRAALIFARGVANVLKRSVEYIRGHAETSVTGKWDPGHAAGKTIDLVAFRRDAANLSTHVEDNVPLTDDDVRKILDWPLVNRGTRTFTVGQMLVALDDAIGVTKTAVDGVPAAVWGHEVPRPDATAMPAGALLGFTDRAASLAANTAATVAAAAQRAGLSDEDVRRVAEAAAGITADDIAAQLTVVRKDGA